MDKTLRDAERSGDSAKLLRERLKVGEIDREIVILAARLGHPGANALFPVEVMTDALDTVFLGASSAIGVQGRVRLLADWAEAVADLWSFEYPKDGRPKAAVEAARAWADCPCPDHLAVATAARTAAQAALGVANAMLADADWLDEESAEYSRFYARRAIRAAALAASAASATTGADVHRDLIAAFERAEEDEGEWQRLRLAGYLLGEIKW